MKKQFSILVLKIIRSTTKKIICGTHEKFIHTTIFKQQKTFSVFA